MSSLRRHEGYFLMDHTDSPGVPDSVVVAQGLSFGAGQAKFESSTFTCSHCEAVVVMNPDRSRERGYCKKCDHLLCDKCETIKVKTGKCYPYKAMVQDILNAIDRSGDSTKAINSILLIP